SQDRAYTRIVKVVLHDRTNGLGQEVRETAHRKLTRLEHHFGRVVDAEVEFSEERKRSGLSTTVCRITLHLDGRRAPVLHARERGADAQSALDLALDRIDRQVVAFKEKVTHRKQAASPVRVPPDEGRGKQRPAEPELKELDDAGLRARSDELRERARGGEDLDELLIEAFALCREAGRRTVGLRHFDVQLVGGIVLHQGKIAEMKTGEGKTLVASL